MQEILVQKQQDEKQIDQQLKDKIKYKQISDLGHEISEGFEVGLNLKNVLFDRDNLQEGLMEMKKRNEELQKKLSHFEEVQLQL